MRTGRNRMGSRRGSELVEGVLTMLPFFALVFLIIDTSYGIFVKATLEYAVQAGVNYAATGGTGAAGQVAAIQQTVQTQSMGLLANAGTLNVNFYPPASMTTSLGTGAGANAAGNIVAVDVTYPFSPLAPLFRSGATINITASAATVLQTNPPPSL